MWENKEHLKGKSGMLATLIIPQEPSDYHHQGIFQQCTVMENIAGESKPELKPCKQIEIPLEGKCVRKKILIIQKSLEVVNQT